MQTFFGVLIDDRACVAFTWLSTTDKSLTITLERLSLPFFPYHWKDHSHSISAISLGVFMKKIKFL